MTFRRTNPDDHRRKRDWHTWIATNGRILKSIGLPPEVYLSQTHWLDFLENGHLHWHQEDATGFEFSQLSYNQMVRLYEFLLSTNEFEPEYYPMIGWIRIRTGHQEGS